MTRFINGYKINLINEFLKDPDRKPLFQITCELFYLFFIYSPAFYKKANMFVSYNNVYIIPSFYKIPKNIQGQSHFLSY